MTSAETLAAAAALIRAQHGADCPEHEAWAVVAARFENPACEADALAAARRFLATQEVAC